MSELLVKGGAARCVRGVRPASVSLHVLCLLVQGHARPRELDALAGEREVDALRGELAHLRGVNGLASPLTQSPPAKNLGLPVCIVSGSTTTRPALSTSTP